MTQDQPRIVVMGVCGCGKSTVGQALSARTGLEFRDGDAFHPQANVDKMHAGHPLDDDDRRPWLANIGQWLAQQPHGAVVACSALKRSYRDQLRSEAPGLFFVHLDGPRQEAARRVLARPGHFMPASLVDSQYATLEPLAPTEAGVTLDFTRPVTELVDDVLRVLS